MNSLQYIYIYIIYSYVCYIWTLSENSLKFIEYFQLFISFPKKSQLSAVPARPFLCTARWHTESCPIGQHSNIHLLALKNAACHNSSNIQTSVKYFDTNLFLLIKCTVLHIVTKFNIQMKYTRTLL